jgi:hypothetical protein
MEIKLQNGFDDFRAAGMADMTVEAMVVSDATSPLLAGRQY